MKPATAIPRRRLTVLSLPAWYPSPSQPISGIFTQGQALAAQRDNDVVVVADAESGDGVRALCHLSEHREEGLRVFRVHYRSVPGLDAAGYLWGIQRVLRTLRREGRPADIIHAHVHRAGWAAVLIGAVNRIPVVISEHSSEFASRTLSTGARRRASWAFRRADLVCPVSEDLHRKIEAYGMRARFKVVPNQVNVDLFHPPATPAPRPPIRVVNVAMHGKVKGLAHLLEAFALLEPGAGRLQLDLVGDGPERSTLTTLVSDLGIAEQVVFHGMKTPVQIAAMLRRSHVFVLPSLSENMPVALVEAQATGLPVVATTVGGVPEMVTPESGVLVKPGDTEELASALRLLLRTLDDYNPAAIARSAREQWSYDAVGSKWSQIYRDVIARRG